MRKVVIIGGVAGGASCAARLRRLDESAEIVLLERGAYISYANCGLPYHVGDVIKARESLLVQTPEAMRKKFRVDVRVKNEAIAIDRAAKTVTVRRAETGETYTEAYDTLVLSTGSSPVRPPIPGIDSPRIETLWTVPDTDRIRALVQGHGAHSAAIIGGGFIGLEMAENLHRAGLQVSIVEMLDQVMAPLDYEMAQLLHENLAANGVALHLGDGVSAFADDGRAVTVTLKSGKTVTAELVILAIGVRPNSELAKAAGLALNARGGVVTDASLRTSDPDIYAVGDVAEVEDFIFGDRTMIPLAGPANKQGRIAADNIAGGAETYEGTQGTAVAKVFDLTAASTGANEKTLIRRGLVRGKDYETVIITQNSHAGYYPGAVPLTLKLLFAADGKKLYGAQIVGPDGVDKRIDTLAVAIRLGASVHDLTRLELAYAPPYSSAKDPVNMAGFTAENVLTGKVRFAPWNAVETMPDAVLLDVRENAELLAFALPGAVHIPLGQLRDRLGELDKTKTIIPFCAIGVRSYNAARILMQNGFADVQLYPAGTRFYQSTHYQTLAAQAGAAAGPAAPVADSGQADTSALPTACMRIDCSGLQCPGPIMKVFETMKGMQDGEVLEVSASDPGFARDIGAWCRRTGNTMLGQEKRGADYVALVRKSTGPAAAGASPIVRDTPQGKTIIVFSGDLDKVLASFIIANGAAAMGRPVTMFFTFWGLTVLRKAEKQPVKKTFMESMFGAMLPRGSKKLRLSRMNMGGMGTAMMKKIMNDKNVDSLETLIRSAIRQGVKIVACTMSMDVMGIKEEELIDGVELGGVGAYLGDAEESNVNLFI
jgi:NADPH-dependent 2,4-dienoyl-CoA reductase/sulfur reductase-like enzyme/peroxiredoxin family protein/TusA-related sulfurtransferase/rhodanese-related sulfurtransferase